MSKYTLRVSIIQFILFCKVKHHKFAPEGFAICTHTTSLTFDLTSDHEKCPPKNPFTGKTGKKPSGEQQRRIPLPG